MAVNTLKRIILEYRLFKKLSVRSFGFVILILSQSFFVELYSQPLAAGKGKFFGSSIKVVRSIFGNYFNQVTADDAGKWGSVEVAKDSYNWTTLDNIYNYAITNNFPYRHHNLVWGSQQPGWITSLDSANQRAQIEEWFKLVGERYPKINFVDVVNEPFNGVPSYKKALGGDGKTGWDWVITAFQLARKYLAQGVQLHINEFNVLHSNTVTDNYIKLIDTLRVRGLIDGIGIQGHYFEFKSSAGSSPSYTYSIAAIQSNLNKLVATGLPVYITEFDINEADDNIQLENYKTYFPIFWENKGVKGVTLWGYLQYEIWKTNGFLLTDRFVERPAMQWLRTYIQSPFTPILISPINTINVPLKATLKWNKSESATSYKVQVSQSNSFTTTVIDTTVTDTVLVTKTLKDDAVLYWRVNATNDKGTSPYSTVAYFVTEKLTSVNDKNEIVPSFKLAQNYPNPFNPVTRIQYFVPKESYISLKVYDLLGEAVATLFEGNKNEGVYEVDFDGSNMPSGVYIYQLRSGNFVDAKKLVLLK